VIRQDALPADLLARLRAELAQTTLEAWGMRQGQTVNRVIPLPTGRQGSALSDVEGFFNGPKVRHLAGYAAGRSGHVITALQTICVDPQSGDADPQANLHADTLHTTAKVWLFLNDVGEHDGPFAYVPGSHKLTADRLAWEHEQALSWRERRDDPHHAAGSFRLPEARLGDLGYGLLRTFPVRENTLVVADTFGFHRRCPSRRPTIRTSLYGVLRRNPFVPWNGGDPLELPFLNGNAMRLHLAMQDRRARAGKSVVYHAEGPLLADAAPTL